MEHIRPRRATIAAAPVPAAADAPPRVPRRRSTAAMDADLACPPAVKRVKREPLDAATGAVLDGAALAKRETAVCAAERKVAAARVKLDKQCARVRGIEERAARLAGSADAEVQRGLLALVQAKLTCALCLDMILTPPICGHSFCAHCIAKVFFNALHDDCGCWHENVTCPTCRARLPYTKFELPRSATHIPFALNRALDKFVADFAESLSVGGDDVKLAEWRARDERGRAFMRDLFQVWETCTAVQFVAMKRRLGL